MSLISVSNLIKSVVVVTLGMSVTAIAKTETSTTDKTTTKAATPKATTSKSTTSKVAKPKATTSKETTPKATTSKETTPKATTPKATTPKAKTPKATTSKDIVDEKGDSIAIDISQLSTTKDEVAVLQVLSEICPPMLNTKQKQSFIKAYNKELSNLMPTISDPRQALQYLATQSDYQKILNDTRQWTLNYSKEDNKEVCVELAESAQ